MRGGGGAIHIVTPDADSAAEPTPATNSVGEFTRPELEHAFEVWNTMQTKERRHLTFQFLIYCVLCVMVDALMFFGDEPNFNGSANIGVVCMALAVFLSAASLWVLHIMSSGWAWGKATGDEKFQAWAISPLGRTTTFLLCGAFLPAMMLFWHQMWLGNQASNILIMEKHIFSCRVLDGFVTAGQMFMTLASINVFLSIFKPKPRWVISFLCWAVFLQVAMIGYITEGFRSDSSVCLGLAILFYLLALGTMLVAHCVHDRTQRGLFLRARSLQNTVDVTQRLLDTELKLKALAEDVAREQGRCDAERLITAFLCHEIRNPMNGKVATQ